MQANEKTIIGVDHGYAAIKTAHCVFSTGLMAYNHEPYTRQDVLEYEGKWYVCGTGRQPVQREKMANDTYYLLTLAAIARELERRRLPHRCTVALASGLPLTSYGRQKGSFKKYLLRSPQPVKYRYEGEAYEVTVEGVWLYPQGYSALAMHPDLIAGEPSFLLMDIGGWTVDMMRLDNGSASAGTCRSLELGMIRCLDEAREQVLRDTGLSLTDAQIERVLSGQPCSMDEEARGVIERQGRQYTEHLLSAAMEAGFDLKALPVVILGGGAGVAARNLRESDRTAGSTRRALSASRSRWRPAASPSEKTGLLFVPSPARRSGAAACVGDPAGCAGRKENGVCGGSDPAEQGSGSTGADIAPCSAGGAADRQHTSVRRGGNSARPDAGFSGRSVKGRACHCWK